jgi:hypothetical protein
VKAYRERLRQQSARPIETWMPEVHLPEFIREAHRQSLAVAQSVHARRDQGFIDTVSDASE